MKGSSADVALAVEGSVVMIGVSRAYKESSNCAWSAVRLAEKKPMIPLMFVEGYEADGWLACCWALPFASVLW